MKALSLFSGGLDSQLAVCLILDQDIEVIALNFSTPFFGADPAIAKAAHKLNIELQTITLGAEYMELLRRPAYGFGKHMNPCIDCHGLMLRRALSMLPELKSSFVISGEVLGQRPMSQNKQSLQSVLRLAGEDADLVLRPLSAKLLPITKPEREGWVDRDRLLDINGRSRKVQMELAEHYQIEEYPTPAGGCLLTQENFSRRLQRYLLEHPEADLDELQVLKFGRHFYMEDGSLLIVGRHQTDNQSLNHYAADHDLQLKVAERPGPLAILRSIGRPNETVIKSAAAIVARYSDAKDLALAGVRLNYRGNLHRDEVIQVRPLALEEMPLTY